MENLLIEQLNIVLYAMGFAVILGTVLYILFGKK